MSGCGDYLIMVVGHGTPIGFAQGMLCLAYRLPASNSFFRAGRGISVQHKRGTDYELCDFLITYPDFLKKSLDASGFSGIVSSIGIFPTSSRIF
jgi:hypothetical protein